MSTKAMIQLIADYFKTQPVLKAWLFGSFARGEETEDSDLDILVEYDKNARISLLVRDIERLSHMLEAINVLINYKEHHTLADAKSDPIVYFGLVKHVEIIGEAVYKLTHEFRDIL